MATRQEIEVDSDRLLAALDLSERVATHTTEQLLQRLIGADLVRPSSAQALALADSIDARGLLEHWRYHFLKLSLTALADGMSRAEAEEYELRHVWKKLKARAREEAPPEDTDVGFRESRRTSRGR